ncbi:hypothetical protein IW140_003896 [Coemansia sp. RSA 1813]|nr:hypothetical protein IW140_003896 [Coemansia sp. RSA 1813]
MPGGYREHDDDFVKEISKKPNANAIYPQAVDNGITNKPIDLATSFGDDDVQVLPTEDSRAECVSVRAPEHARISPPKGQHFLPSSPPLLRANSPTIRRFNSGGSQLVVLANETQDADNDSLSVSPSAPVTDILSGNTLASGCMANTPLLYNGGADSASTLVHTHSAGNAITNIYYPLPGSLPPSRGTASMGPCSEPKDNSAELSSDPISEFLTPTAPPKNSQVAPSFSELAKMAEPIGSVPLFSDTQDSREPESDMEEDNRSITQWYKENLFTQRLDDGGGRNDDDDPLSDVLNNSILDTESGSETEMCKELNQPNRSSVATGVSASSGKHPGNQNKDDSDDGYSSPLEGFWDLRRSAQGSIFDRDMYINQFEPSQRQPVSRKKRKDTQRNIVQSNFYDRSSTPKARAGTSTLGSQGNIPYNVKCSTAPANLRGKGAIRPLVSSRLPRPAANRPAAAKSAANPPGYNHYADDPHLDIIGSMGWEGGGMSRFG